MYIMYNNVKFNKIGQLETHLVPGRLFDNFGSMLPQYLFVLDI